MYYNPIKGDQAELLIEQGELEQAYHETHEHLEH